MSAEPPAPPAPPALSKQESRTDSRRRWDSSKRHRGLLTLAKQCSKRLSHRAATGRHGAATTIAINSRNETERHCAFHALPFADRTCF